METISELRELTPEELRKALRDTRTELVNLRLRKQLGQVEDTSMLSRLRRQVARIITLLREKERASATA
ncbi:MAG: 50S ribosomal protein L29 [Opitutales bacterium]